MCQITGLLEINTSISTFTNTWYIIYTILLHFLQPKSYFVFFLTVKRNQNPFGSLKFLWSPNTIPTMHHGLANSWHDTEENVFFHIVQFYILQQSHTLPHSGGLSAPRLFVHCSRRPPPHWEPGPWGPCVLKGHWHQTRTGLSPSQMQSLNSEHLPLFLIGNWSLSAGRPTRQCLVHVF